MIASLRGTLTSKSPTEIVVEVQGIGFGLSIPLSTYEALGEVSSSVLLLTHLHVREDVLQLYGFATEAERHAFRLLISVNGIGPKMAQGILSGIPVPELRQHILAGNAAALTLIPGVGKKIAERLVVELRDKIARTESSPPSSLSHDQSQVRTEALGALISLGYSRNTAEKALRSALLETKESTPTLEHLIKSALRHTAP